MFVAGPRDASAAATNLLTLCVFFFFRGPLHSPIEPAIHRMLDATSIQCILL